MVPSFDLSSHDALARSSAVATTLSVHPGTREPRVQSMPGTFSKHQGSLIAWPVGSVCMNATDPR